jgi:hypothetical protein
MASSSPSIPWATDGQSPKGAAGKADRVFLVTLSVRVLGLVELHRLDRARRLDRWGLGIDRRGGMVEHDGCYRPDGRAGAVCRPASRDDDRRCRNKKGGPDGTALSVNSVETRNLARIEFDDQVRFHLHHASLAGWRWRAHTPPV